MDALLSLVPGGGITALFAALVAFLVGAAGLFIKGRSDGRRDERARQAARERKARTIADEIDDAVAGRSPDDNREELRKWARR
jgi:hypothetical protein